MRTYPQSPHAVPRAALILIWLVTMLGTADLAAAQPVPQPFPRPGQPPSQPPPTAPEPAAPQAPPARAVTGVAEPDVPTEATLGIPVYPSAQFLVSYNAGFGQRFYLFGTNSPFEDMVTYYRNVLDDGGDRVFNAPATHMFDVGRFRQESMAFPPGVTIKDYTWNESEGFLNPNPDNGPARFKTVIQIVPPRAPAGR